MIYRGPGILAVVFPHPLLLHVHNVSKLDRRATTHRKIEKERELADKRRGRDGGGAKSNDGEKSWTP
jgi:hypothetical protein